MVNLGPATTDELDEPTNQRFYRREVIAERVGWAIMAALLVLAVAGALGRGWLSRRVVSTADAMTTHYSADRLPEAVP